MSDSFDLSSSSEQVPEDVQTARKEWNEIETQQTQIDSLPKEEGIGGTVIDRNTPITFHDSREFLIEESNSISEYPPFPKKSCCCQNQNQAIPYRNAWTLIYRISKIKFNEENLTHHRILNLLYSLITGSQTPPPRFGPHWVDVGFQSKDPITDLRASGMLGLIISIDLFTHYFEIAHHCYDVSRIKEHEFPFMLILIVFISEILESCKVSSTILNYGNSIYECWERFTKMLAGMVSKLASDWESGHMDYGHNYHYFQYLINLLKSDPYSLMNRVSSISHNS